MIDTAFISDLGFTLDEMQPHMLGERSIMQAATTASGKKLVLLGTRTSDGARVVIKIARHPAGIREIEQERVYRAKLPEISFAYGTFHTPEELLFINEGKRAIFVQRFIETDSQFIDRPLLEQFDLALKAFKTQESAHATTFGHGAWARTFGSVDSAYYLSMFALFKDALLKQETDPRLAVLLTEAEQALISGKKTLEQYTGFLTHVDFVPHNLRVKDGEIYLLDASSLRFGNKYEGWARFLNFMTLYNPPLEEALVKYVALNRAPEESASLRLMRIYRLTEIIWYYANALSRSDGDLHTLNAARVSFWTSVLEAMLKRQPLSPEIRARYMETRDALRSPEEKERQKNLH